MKARPSAKRLTFLSFSIVAISIIMIHYFVFELTTDDLESLYIQNRMQVLAEHTKQLAANANLSNAPFQEIQTQGQSEFDQLIRIYQDFNQLPDWFPKPEDMEYDIGTDAVNEELEIAYFLIKTKLNIADTEIDVIIAENNTLYELSEEQLFTGIYKQLILSLLLMGVSLFVILKISELLTNPISQFVRQLENKKSDDFKPLEFSKAPATTELALLLSTFNNHLERLQTLLERERNFSRYASHELRTPLMIMRGAITLMGESSDPDFIDKQKTRLKDATLEMEEFIETLLSIGKTVEDESLNKRVISQQEIEEIAQHHQSTLINKSVSWSVNYRAELTAALPESTFKILLGNIIKNSFSYTSEGNVVITVDAQKLWVEDTGKGLKNGITKPDGYGLGLLLVKDICKQYSIKFELRPNESEGCTVELDFTS